MRRGFALPLATIVLTASLGAMAPPAAAADACFEAIPALGPVNTVRFENGQIRIDPNGVGPDVAMIRDYVLWIANEAQTCLPDEIDCLIAKLFEIVNSLDPLNANLRYVYQDPMTGEIVIDYGRLIADVTACAP